MIELADEFDWAFKGVEMAIAMIADMHHAAARGAIPVQHVKFPESEVGVGWPAVGHCIDLRIVPVGLHVLLSAGRNDTKQPCSVLAPFLAVEIFRVAAALRAYGLDGRKVFLDWLKGMGPKAHWRMCSNNHTIESFERQFDQRAICGTRGNGQEITIGSIYHYATMRGWVKPWSTYVR